MRLCPTKFFRTKANKTKVFLCFQETIIILECVIESPAQRVIGPIIIHRATKRNKFQNNFFVKMKISILIGFAFLASVSAKICWQNCSGMTSHIILVSFCCCMQSLNLFLHGSSVACTACRTDLCNGGWGALQTPSAEMACHLCVVRQKVGRKHNCRNQYYTLYSWEVTQTAQLFWPYVE